YDLSAMTRDEATALVAASEGKLCARFYRRTDGTVLTADCPVGVRKKRVRRAIGAAVGGGLAAAAAAATWTTTCSRTMGEVTVSERDRSDPSEQVDMRATLGA